MTKSIVDKVFDSLVETISDQTKTNGFFVNRGFVAGGDCVASLPEVIEHIRNTQHDLKLRIKVMTFTHATKEYIPTLIGREKTE